MQALQFHFSLARYAFGQIAARFYPSLLWSGLANLRHVDVAEPSLPGPQWARLHTRLGGICGSDLHTIYLHTSPYFQPFSSFPFTLGHENVATVAETGPMVEGWSPGERVVVEPLLWCGPRGQSELCPACRRGEINLCARTTVGDVAPGPFVGACRDTGGSWSPAFVAHQSQLYRVPAGVSDENALMVEPFACALHAVLQRPPEPGETVLVIGAGAIGLCVVAALRAIDCRSSIIVQARYDFQAEAALRLGADEVIRAADAMPAVAARQQGQILKPLIGRRVLVGGVDHVFECVGTDRAIDDAARLARAGGHVSLVGLPGIVRRQDWSVIFDQELRLRAAYAYHHAERYAGLERSTFALALDWMATGRLDLGWLVTHRYRLADYRRALAEHARRSSAGIIKAAFDFTGPPP